MRQNKEVVVFTLIVTFILFCYSFFAAFSHTDVLHLKNVSILADVLYDKDKVSPIKPAIPDTVISPADKITEAPLPGMDTGKKIFSKYLEPKILTNFSADNTKPALPRMMARLHALKNGKKGKIRVAWFGDSLVEADILSMEFRKQMQQYFGAYGVGFIPATSITSKFRITATHNWKGDWAEENFRSKDITAPLFFSGHTFFTGNGEVTIQDNTVRDTPAVQLLEKSLICGPSKTGTVSLVVDGRQKQYRAEKLVNRILLDNSNSRAITVGISDSKLPVYGISMEPESGVIVDNFSFRGISGVELAKLDSSFLSTLAAEDNYDLVVLEYGANILYRPNDMDYSWYGATMNHVLRKIKKAMPNTEILVISTADRAFKYDGQWRTAKGIYNLVKVQAEMAYNNGGAFYNMFLNMGGDGTICKWATSNPPLAKEDRIHPNYKASIVMGDMFYQSFMDEYNKAETNTKPLSKR